jgi:uncharacterized repeat protein (TIGR03843 family)
MGRARSSDPGAGGERRELSFEAAERILRDAPGLEVLGLMPNSSNYTFLARLDADAEAGGPVVAVYKPEQGETPLWDFPSGTLHRREVASYRLSRALGWPLIPPTVTRADGPMGVGALQLFIETADERGFFAVRDRRPAELVPIALFDVITNNADRKAGHHLVDADGLVWVIDHGLTFHVEPKLRTVIWSFAGEPAPAALRADLERVAGELDGALGGELSELLRRAELEMLRRRVDRVAARGWRFPAPSSAWSVPWPPV